MEIHIVMKGKPITKKNSQQILRGKGGRPFIAPSTQYKQYAKRISKEIPQAVKLKIEDRVTVRCTYYMPNVRAVDLTNLMEATDDILVAAGVLADDSCRVIASHDGSRVKYDKLNPRVEVSILPFEELDTL